MGTLNGMCYPTIMFAKLADHTYVQCGTGGMTWSCWGGHTGGKPLRAGNGSTNRADAIAQPDQKAGITCYLINGVCHQAANRILLSANTTVRGAKGYWISTALFGVYGRPAGPLHCQAPFNQYPGVTGDLPACMTQPSAADAVVSQLDERERAFLSSSLRMYTQIDEPGFRTESAPDMRRFVMELFALQVQYRLGDDFLLTVSGRELVVVRDNFEERRLELEAQFAAGELSVDAFVERINELTIHFQKRASAVLSDADYVGLFDLTPDDIVVLGDPDIARRAYSEGNDGRTA